MDSDGYLIRCEDKTEYFVTNADYDQYLKAHWEALVEAARERGEKMKSGTTLNPTMMDINELLCPKIGVWPMKR